VVRGWFREAVGAPSAPQREGWPAIASGEHALILAPTGTGKTFAAFLWELNQLLAEAAQAPLANAVHLLYVSPLKALSNDVERNLARPLEQLRERFAAAGHGAPEIRVAVRTGDTPSSARQRMLRKTPHILVTTPESLHIMLTSVKGRGMFSALRAVIVDEIHAVAGTKRGAHHALTIERLERLTAKPPQRIGLSATQKPLEEIAKFLGGDRPVRIVDCGAVKVMETRVVSPVADLGDVGGTIWTSVAPLVLREIQGARTTLVFVNNRAQAEKVAGRVNILAGEELALPYHGSLSRERRHKLETALKAGEVRALVTTSALELGIDIGSVDLVLNIQSPKRVASALQRIGRAGHSLEAVSRGIFVPTFRDDAAETLAIVGAMREGDVEPTRVVQNALDVLAQVLVAIVAVEDDWTADALYDFVRRAYPYHALTRAAFDEVLAMLTGKYPAHVAAELEARLVLDGVTGKLTAPRASRLVAVTSGGTIPDRGLYAVVLPDRTRLGELDEEFVHETRIGDVFQLGSSTWRVQAIEHDRVIVQPAPGSPARMPFWHGEFMARSSHLTPRLGVLRRELAEASTLAEAQAIGAKYGADESTATSLVTYVHAQRAATSTVPDDRTIVVEHFRDDTGSVRIVLHAPFGGRVNAPWGMALAQRARDTLAELAGGERPAAFEVQVLTTDDGIMLRLPPLAGDPPLDVVRDLSVQEAGRRVLEEVGGSALFGARFRMNAARALLLPRGNPRRRMPLWLQRLKALDLLAAVQEFPSFPILVETYRDVLQDAFDMPAFNAVLQALAEGRIRMVTAATEVPSPFAASLQFGFVMDWMYADDQPRAEQRAALLSLDRALLDEVLGGEGADDATLEILERLLARRRGTAPGRRARTADELALLLDRAGDLSMDELQARVAGDDEGRLGDPLGELLAGGRAVLVPIPSAAGTPERYVLAEERGRYDSAFGDGAGPLTPEAARREILARYLLWSGPVSVAEIRARYDFAVPWLERRLSEWTRAGRLAQGIFGGDRTAPRWAPRKLVEEARRRELAELRRQITPVEMAEFARFLARWQHVAPDARLHGDEAAASAVRQLYGIARPGGEWLREIVPARVADGHAPSALASLTASGEAVWVGSMRAEPASGPRPSTARPIAIRFIPRGVGRAWIAPADDAGLGATARQVRDLLAVQGASFFADLQGASGLGTTALRDGLRELVGAGLVTNDSMDALEQLLRWRPVQPTRGRDTEADATRWLPADFVPSRPVVQRRPNLRRLPKWRRPDKEGADRPWGGRWSLVHTPGVLGPERGEQELAELVARQWLARYGVVSRDWWRREHPAVSWRAIYHELRRLEYRGEVRRGYFVRGLAGAQFALPGAVEMLREPAADDVPMLVLSAGDPANAWALPLANEAKRDPLTRPRGGGSHLVLRAGQVILSSEGHGKRIRLAPDASRDDVTAAVRALVQRLQRRRRALRARDVIVEQVDGVEAPGHRMVDAFTAAGFHVELHRLRFHAAV
jgi:ATP-dependent Lhr-like helicase